MKTRLINAAIFLVLYLAFLAWYDGWGMDPFTAEEVDTLTVNDPNLRRFLKDDDGEEFFMLNLNRYEYAENEDQQGQPVGYQNYGQAVIQMILKNAGHPIYSGEIPDYLLDGDAKDASWHEIILMRYRSRRDFVSMVTSDEYLKIAQDRSGGIEYAEVTPTRADVNLTTPRFVVLALLVVIALFIDRQIRRARYYSGILFEASRVPSTRVEERDALASRMTSAQIAEAQRLAREWDAAHPREPSSPCSSSEISAPSWRAQKIAGPYSDTCYVSATCGDRGGHRHPVFLSPGWSERSADIFEQTVDALLSKRLVCLGKDGLGLVPADEPVSRCCGNGQRVAVHHRIGHGLRAVVRDPLGNALRQRGTLAHRHADDLL